MQVFLHRANCFAQLYKARNLGIGIEVDIRTWEGIPLLSHDPIMMDEAQECEDLETFLSVAAGYDMPVLLDFKETGIIDIVIDKIGPIYLHDRCLAIDLITPDVYYAQSKRVKTLVRDSKYETIKEYANIRSMYEHAGYWLDYTKTGEDLLHRHYSMSCYLVSPELHGWDLEDEYIETAVKGSYKAVCTDYPERWLEAINGYNSSNS